ncbi:hypothetical protein B0H12DRAFT_757434 [Mycena haematopus]|nr:hypothetical protein B0H12DRAFT_757434 [Mycena haematopus]
MPPKLKEKKLKFKTYSAPPKTHYLLINNPWPFDTSVSDARNPQTFINAVVGWLCCMVHDLCDIAIDASKVRLFSQSTHRDLVAEIDLNDPKPLELNFNLNLLLGAHHSSAFLTPEYAGQDNRTSLLYEYNYVRFNSPEKTNWTSYTASYTNLPANFPIKHEDTGSAYPTPSPIGAKPPALAKPLPTRLILGHPDSIQQTPAPPTDPSPPANQVVEPSAVPPGEQSKQSSSPNESPPPTRPPQEVTPSQSAFTPDTHQTGPVRRRGRRSQESSRHPNRRCS